MFLKHESHRRGDPEKVVDIKMHKKFYKLERFRHYSLSTNSNVSKVQLAKTF